jgi:hypothetical protein
VISYLRTWFLIDIVSVIPLNEFFDNGGGYNKLARIARLPKLYRIIRIIKIIRMLKVIKSSTEIINII